MVRVHETVDRVIMVRVHERIDRVIMARVYENRQSNNGEST